MKIHCPGCNQRFEVTKDHDGKTVECGSCSHRFKISLDEMGAKKEKFYPGEKPGPGLEGFGRTTAEVGEIAFQQAQYQPNVNPDLIGPPRPRRVLAVISGVLLMLTMIIVFLVAGREEGMMRDVETYKRFILCGFTALVGSILVIYGMAHKRPQGILVAIVFTVILMAMPVFFQGNPTSLPAGQNPSGDKPGGDSLSGMNDGSAASMESYLAEIRYGPVEKAISEYPKDAVIAIFVRNASPSSRRSISAYLYEATDRISREISYDRGDDNMMGLIVMVEQKISIEQMAELCAKFGRVEKISEDLRLIDVMAENSKLAKLDESKIIDASSQDFETQNLKALDSIDPAVQMDAVKRLARAEPRARRDDITRKLTAMLPESKTDLQLEIIKTLTTWAEPGDGAEQVVLQAVKKIHREGKVNRNAMEFMIKFKVEEAGDILFDLWDKEPVAWSELVESLGDGAQVLLLPKLEEMDAAHIVSASAILGKTATKAAIPLIEEVMKKKEGQAKKSLQAAIDEIGRRS